MWYIALGICILVLSISAQNVPLKNYFGISIGSLVVAHLILTKECNITPK